MKKFLALFLIISLVTVGYGSEDDSLSVAFENHWPEKQHREVSQLVTQLLSQSHYQKKKLNDSLSSEIFDRFLKKMDFNRLYFLESDIAQFESHRYRMDNYLGSGQVKSAYNIFNIYQQRYAERLEYVYERLQTPFDFTVDEYIELDRTEEPWARNRAELNEIWRKRLKHDALNLKIAGKEWSEIVETLTKRYQRSQKNLAQFHSEDVFQIIMNSFAESYDPHTNYFSPNEFDDFKIAMSQSLEGIGARLLNRNDYTTVTEIVAGGPADKSKQLHPNDRIISVGQGRSGEMVDVIGWRIDDVVQLIRGKKNTVVRLEILPASEGVDAKADTIALVRDKIKLEDKSAKSEYLEIEHEGKNLKIGVITIPSFYSDFDARRSGVEDYKSTTRDVEKFLDEYNREGVDGVIVDLRRNGGGFLNEAVELTGLFIEKGPVVQVRDMRGKIEVEADRNPTVKYHGPLAVVVDRLSASASEIFAAAIQDYKRGIIIGNQSFGKGTVQRPVDLNRIYQDPRDPDLKLGQLKMTIAKFYRVDGRSTQHVGVIPDIGMPSRLEHMEIGENTRENALLWDQIRSARYRKANDFANVIPQLVKQHNIRMKSDDRYSDLLSEIDEFKERREQSSFSLQETKRRAQRDAAEKKNEEEVAENAEEENKEPTVNDDFLLVESGYILADYIILNDNRKAARYQREAK